MLPDMRLVNMVARQFNMLKAVERAVEIPPEVQLSCMIGYDSKDVYPSRSRSG